MKKCPFCKADIEDNARFCLYCMKSLDEKEVIAVTKRKKTWWIFAIVGICIVTLLAIIMLQPRDREMLSSQGGTSTLQTTEEQTSELTEETVLQTQNSVNGLDGDDKVEDTKPASNGSGVNGGKDKKKPETTKPTTTPTEPEASTENTTPVTEGKIPTEPEASTENTTPITEEKIPTEPEASTENTTPVTEGKIPTVPIPEETAKETVPETTQETEPETTAPEMKVSYTYRKARAGDEFSANYQNAGNDIVITGVSQTADDGVYDIPSKIDDKRVIAIVANAFYGADAKTVYIPATVKTIWNYAFNGSGLKHIYFRGNAVYAEGKAFPAGVTIHCSASCSDRNLRYYKNCAASYDATWKEWNG